MTGTELRKLRKSTGLSQERFGVNMLGRTGGTISRWERGIDPIGDLTAEAITARVAKHLEKLS